MEADGGMYGASTTALKPAADGCKGSRVIDKDLFSQLTESGC